MNVTEFLKKLSARLGGENNGDSDALIFFKCFLDKDSLIEAVERSARVPAGWHEADLSEDAWAILYNIATNTLRSAASTNYSEAHPDVYDNADEVSQAFCAEMKNSLDIDVEPIKIESYIKQMERAGMIKVEDGFVKLTPEGKETAKNVEREIKGSSN